MREPPNPGPPDLNPPDPNPPDPNPPAGGRPAPDLWDSDPSDRSFVRSLRGRAQPAPVRRPVQEVWYQAGLEAGRRRANRWRAAAGVAGAAAAAMAALALRPPPTADPSAVRVVYVERPVPPPPGGPPSLSTSSDQPPAPPASSAYLRLCDALAQQRWEVLPAGSSGGPSPDLRTEPPVGTSPAFDAPDIRRPRPRPDQKG